MSHPLDTPTLAHEMAIAILAAPLAARLRLQTDGPVDRFAYQQVWFRLSGLPEQEALAVLAEAGVTEAQVEDERQRRARAAVPMPVLPGPATEGQIGDWYLPADAARLGEAWVVPHGRFQGQRVAERPDLQDLASRLHALALAQGDRVTFTVTSASGHRYRGQRLATDEGPMWSLRQIAQMPPTLAALDA